MAGIVAVGQWTDAASGSSTAQTPLRYDSQKQKQGHQLRLAASLFLASAPEVLWEEDQESWPLLKNVQRTFFFDHLKLARHQPWLGTLFFVHFDLWNTCVWNRGKWPHLDASSAHKFTNKCRVFAKQCCFETCEPFQHAAPASQHGRYALRADTCAHICANATAPQQAKTKFLSLP